MSTRPRLRFPHADARLRSCIPTGQAGPVTEEQKIAERDYSMMTFVFVDLSIRRPGRSTLSDLQTLLRHVNGFCTLGPVHYSIIVDSLFLALFVGVCGGIEDRKHILLSASSDTVWQALRFLAIPRQVLHNLVECVGMVAPCPYVSEEDYGASIKCLWRLKAHKDHPAAAQSPWGPEQEPPDTLARGFGIGPLLESVGPV